MIVEIVVDPRQLHIIITIIISIIITIMISLIDYIPIQRPLALLSQPLRAPSAFAPKMPSILTKKTRLNK
jgi:hypothetical protein